MSVSPVVFYHTYNVKELKFSFFSPDKKKKQKIVHVCTTSCQSLAVNRDTVVGVDFFFWLIEMAHHRQALGSMNFNSKANQNYGFRPSVASMFEYLLYSCISLKIYISGVTDVEDPDFILTIHPGTLVSYPVLIHPLSRTVCLIMIQFMLTTRNSL